MALTRDNPAPSTLTAYRPDVIAFGTQCRYGYSYNRPSRPLEPTP